MALDRRTAWLGATLVVVMVAAIAVRSLDDAGAPPQGQPERTRETPGNGATSRAADDLSIVRLDALKRDRGEPDEGEARNPFRFRPKPPPPAPPPPKQPLASPIPEGPPPPPPIPLKFIGIVQKTDGTRIAVLTDGRRAINGLEGHEIEGQYRILKIGAETLEIAYLDGRGRQTLRLQK